MCFLHNEKGVRWGAKFDETVRQVWAMMEEYIKIRYDKDCTNLRSGSCYGVPCVMLRLVLFPVLEYKSRMNMLK